MGIGVIIMDIILAVIINPIAGIFGAAELEREDVGTESIVDFIKEHKSQDKTL